VRRSSRERRDGGRPSRQGAGARTRGGQVANALAHGSSAGQGLAVQVCGNLDAQAGVELGVPLQVGFDLREEE
jgi:hypothetical protein